MHGTLEMLGLSNGDTVSDGPPQLPPTEEPRPERAPRPPRFLDVEVRREWINGREIRRVTCRPKKGCTIADVVYILERGPDGNWDYDNSVMHSIGVRKVVKRARKPAPETDQANNGDE
jgi:hypothetical protein